MSDFRSGIPVSSQASKVLQLQKAVGNRGVYRLLQLAGKSSVAQLTPDGLVQLIPEVTRRQTRGLMLVDNLSRAIQTAARQYNIKPELLGVILMHESQARERSIWGNERLANAAERAQAAIQGERASVGIGQMEVRTAAALRRRHPELAGGEIVDDLLQQERAVQYVAARLQDLQGDIRTFFSARRASLSPEAEVDLAAIAYNTGWESLRDRNLLDENLGSTLPERVTALRSRSSYLRFTTAYLPLMRVWMQRSGGQQ